MGLMQIVMLQVIPLKALTFIILIDLLMLKDTVPIFSVDPWSYRSFQIRSWPKTFIANISAMIIAKVGVSDMDKI